MQGNKSKYYINGVGLISAQRTYNNAEFLPEILTYDKNVLQCVAPDFKEFLSPTQLRRLSRMMRIGLSAAMICIRDSGRTSMDGIITATGYGFLNDTAVFLKEILDQNEQHITPTHFMQGTYNALSGVVALSIQCKGYNSTHVHKGIAFENALHDAFMQINENAAQSFLVGSYDEADITQYNTHLRLGYFKKEFVPSNKLFQSNTKGTIQGEGASFFCISGEPSPSTWCCLEDVSILYRPEHEQELIETANQLLEENGMSFKDIDLFISGISGDKDCDSLLNAFAASKLSQVPVITYKNLCGDYCTASSFALWLGASILKKQVIPEGLLEQPLKEKPKVILIASQYLGRNYSFMLLKRANPSN